jgi:hypothetical protein
MPGHPKANRDGHVREHVLIAETAIGKPIRDGAIVHHVNGKKDDNRNENLVICENEEYHQLLHLRTRAYRECGHADWRWCRFCRSWDDPKNMKVTSGGSALEHRECRNRWRREFYANTGRRM